MPVKVRVTLSCDHPGCGESLDTEIPSQILEWDFRVSTPLECGWSLVPGPRQSDPMMALCPAHKDLRQ